MKLFIKATTATFIISILAVTFGCGSYESSSPGAYLSFNSSVPEQRALYTAIHSENLDRAELRFYIEELGLNLEEALAAHLRNIFSIGNAGYYSYRGHGLFRYMILPSGQAIYITVDKYDDNYNFRYEKIDSVPEDYVTKMTKNDEGLPVAEGWSDIDLDRNEYRYESMWVEQEYGQYKWYQSTGKIDPLPGSYGLPHDQVKIGTKLVYAGTVPASTVSYAQSLSRRQTQITTSSAKSSGSDLVKRQRAYYRGRV